MKKGYLTKNGEAILEVAVKMFPASFMDNKQESEKLVREIKSMLTFKHHNIIQIYDVCLSYNYLYLFMEYCNGGNLG